MALETNGNEPGKDLHMIDISMLLSCHKLQLSTGKHVLEKHTLLNPGPGDSYV